MANDNGNETKLDHNSKNGDREIVIENNDSSETYLYCVAKMIYKFKRI